MFSVECNITLQSSVELTNTYQRDCLTKRLLSEKSFSLVFLILRLVVSLVMLTSMFSHNFEAIENIFSVEPLLPGFSMLKLKIGTTLKLMCHDGNKIRMGG